MSGIIGGKNHRGSGLIADLGTDGQILTSAGAGVRQIFESVAASGVEHATRIGTYSLESATATKTISDCSFQPTACLFFCGVESANGASWTFITTDRFPDNSGGSYAHGLKYLDDKQFSTRAGNRIYDLNVETRNQGIWTSFDSNGMTWEHYQNTGTAMGPVNWICWLLK